MEQRVTITVADGVADVRLNRADKMNALDPAMFAGINDAIAQLAGMKDVRVAVLSGEGRAFCAGLDMASMAGGGSGNDLAARSHGLANAPQNVAWGWRELPMPVIAAVHGVAVGGGFQVMSGADIRIVHPATRMSIRETYWGLVPDMAGVALWRTLARDDVLRELTYTAREFSGAEALGYGFATRLDEEPRTAALALAREIAGRNPQAVRASKRLYNLAADADAAAVLRAESAEQIALLRSPNQIEAVRANMEKRAAVFAD
ncbi:crotonase/enoyl-CoA hydratase family protein [Sphingomonas sp. MMSM20]|uniref:crotonase/enoyl-CoA hydratase family protein n=1 Tax=Sphingomonas lycopersici TaxID=2951807 RepID=UPI002238AF41|nr:crotonase/enoyl-CoA hydratase family protein [Sphingomonas lycopersici]MCW6531054.1 crotonase/enoyl-CoA hydratase family protein [Sphingomonas lycopersici]